MMTEGSKLSDTRLQTEAQRRNKTLSVQALGTRQINIVKLAAIGSENNATKVFEESCMA